jgi:hypothetical protein
MEDHARLNQRLSQVGTPYILCVRCSFKDGVVDHYCGAASFDAAPGYNFDAAPAANLIYTGIGTRQTFSNKQ